MVLYIVNYTDPAVLIVEPVVIVTGLPNGAPVWYYFDQLSELSEAI